MKKCIYTIYDNVAKIYMWPCFTEPNDAVATRTVGKALEDKTHDLAKHPQDFTLVRMGTFDEVNGTFDQQSKKDVMELSQMVKGE